MNKFKTTLLCSAIAGTMFPFASTLAQTSGDSEDGFAQLDEITVTARKREESLQDIPVSISVINESALAELNVLRQEGLGDASRGISWSSKRSLWSFYLCGCDQLCHPRPRR